MAKGPIRMTMMKVKPMVSKPKPAAPKVKGSTSPVRMTMPTVKPMVSAPTPKPVVRREPKSNVPAPDMSPRAVLARAERIQREEALESKDIPLRSSVTRTTVNERTTPTKKGKR